MTRIFRVLLILALAVVLVDCSNSPSESGGGFEGETVAFSGVVRFSGERLSGATVSFSDLSTSAYSFRTVTDANGAFRLKVPVNPLGHIEIRSADSALARQLVESVPDSVQAFDAVGPVLWRARALLANAPVAQAVVRVLGSTLSTTTAASGSFSLWRTGLGREWVVVALADGTERDLILPPMSDSVLSVPDHSVLLLDDFEGSTTRSALGEAVGSGWWFANDDSGLGGRSSVLPAGSTTDLRNAYTTSGADSGTSLSLQFVVDTTQPIHFDQLGILLADAVTGRWVNLSKVDSISFLAKGSGSIHISFETRTGLEPTQDPAGFFAVDVQVPSTWTRVVVRRSQIVSPPGSRPATQGIPWAVDSKRCRTILFSATASARLALDDIELHGPRLIDLLNQ